MRYLLTIEESYNTISFTFNDYEVMTVFMLTVLSTSNGQVKMRVEKEGEE